MADRAKLSKLAIDPSSNGEASFLGSRYFPPSLIDACLKSDPKGILFGVQQPFEAEQVKRQANERLKGKKLLLCSGAADKLVPHRCSKPFVDWLRTTSSGNTEDGSFYVEDKVYEGIGHTFSPEMVSDAVRFVVDVVDNAKSAVQERMDYRPKI